jgi:hypothetical protein
MQIMNDHKRADIDEARVDGPRQDWVELVRRQVASLRFGSVVITVHDGRVVQVDKLEKVRLENSRT